MLIHMKEKIKYIDMGTQSVCTECDKRYCSCKERLNGTWETNLPIQEGKPPKENTN